MIVNLLVKYRPFAGPCQGSRELRPDAVVPRVASAPTTGGKGARVLLEALRLDGVAALPFYPFQNEFAASLVARTFQSF